MVFLINRASLCPMKLVRHLLLLWGAVITIQPAQGELPSGPCARSFSIEQIRATALNSSPLVAEIDAAFAGELGRAFNTEVLENPELGADHAFAANHIRGDNDPNTQFILSQPLRLSNFGARDRVASLIRKAGDNQKGRQLLEFTQKISLQFYSLGVLQRMKRVLTKAEERAAEKVALVRKSVQEGLLSEGDEKLLEGERYRLLSQRKGVEVSILVMQGELARTAGLSCYPSVTEAAKMPGIPAETVLIDKAENSQFNENTRAEILLNLAHEQTRLADLDAFPRFAPGIIYQHTNDGGDFVGGSLTISVPVWNRNQGNRGQAVGEQVSARRKREFLASGGFQTQVRIQRAASVTAIERAELFSSKAVPAFELALANQERLFSAGRGSVVEVWQTFRTYNDAQIEGLSLWLEAATKRIELSLLVGEEV